MTSYLDLYQISNQSTYRIHLQWFAAEDEGRTEDPTEQKIQKAREEGKVAKSTELTSALVMIFPLVLIALLSPHIIRQILSMMRYYYSDIMNLDVINSGITAVAFFSFYFKIMWPILTIAFLAAFLSNILQIGFLFTTKTITPDFKKIVPNFPRFIQKSFASSEAWFNLGKSIFKVILVVSISYLNIRPNISRLATLIALPLTDSTLFIVKLGFSIIIEVSILLLVLAIPDYLFQRWQHKESLKMSKQEVKEERKQSEGDPLIRSRLRERYREIVSQNMMEAIPQADVIITNPTHFAIALKYDSLSMTAPMVTGKGQDNVALRIRAIAQENGVPIVENKPLARAMYGSVEIGDVVPEEYWEIVSRILAEIYRLNGRSA
ncbi:flagellar biosynthesis protein FlhB [Spirochaeta cellobiosiphila]|uniref:flagellar biosynthesis protein FlhB n=1 Tax=Spirochaeta cellobiosiphila TaxID=504483 RepID=UPI0004169BB2|nr:flagellar biosynthesis protein FlhB [Spirochaeta cellobiosiphila]